MTTATFPGRVLRRVNARLLVAGLLCLPAAAWAASECEPHSLVISMGTQSFHVVPGNNHVGQPIGTIGTTSQRIVFDGRHRNKCRIIAAWAKPSMPAVSGMMYTAADDGQTYPVYRTGIEGIGYVIGAADYFGSQGYLPLRPNVWTETYSDVATIFALGYRMKLIFVTTGPVPIGKHTLSSAVLANFRAKTRMETFEEGADFLANVTFDVSQRTCLVSSAQQLMLKLPPVSASQFLKVPIGAAPAGGARSSPAYVELMCDHDLMVYATLSDANDSGSTADYLSIRTGEGMAEGVGVALYRNVSSASATDWVRAVMGPESSTITSPNAFYVDASSSALDKKHMSLKFRAGYVRRAQMVRPGKVRAAATMTLFYR